VNHETHLWLLVVGATAFIVWAIHFGLALGTWIRERTARAFRNFYIALMIQAGMTSIVLGRATRVWPEAAWIVQLSLFVSPVLVWLLLSGGVVALWTWSHPARRW